MKSLVLAEKPSVARDIARVLKCHKICLQSKAFPQGYMGVGHRVTPRSESMIKIKNGKVSVLPTLIPKKWELVVIKQTSKAIPM